MNFITRRNVIFSVIAVAAMSIFALRSIGAEEKAASTQGQIDSIVKSYLSIQKSLSQDKTEGVSDELGRIRTAATALAESSDVKLKDQAKAIAGHADAMAPDIQGHHQSLHGQRDARLRKH